MVRGHRCLDVDRYVSPLALRRVQGGCRSARAGVRALLRHADGCLPWRLPHRSEPLGRPSTRLPLLPHALRRDGNAVHGVRLRRPAGARQPAQRRPRPRLRGVPRLSARRRRLQHRRRPREQLLGARGDRSLRGDRRVLGRMEARRRAACGGPSLVDHRPASLPARLPDLGRHVRRRVDPPRDPRRECRAVDARRLPRRRGFRSLPASPPRRQRSGRWFAPRSKAPAAADS